MTLAYRAERGFDRKTSSMMIDERDWAIEPNRQACSLRESTRPDRPARWPGASGRKPGGGHRLQDRFAFFGEMSILSWRVARSERAIAPILVSCPEGEL